MHPPADSRQLLLNLVFGLSRFSFRLVNESRRLITELPCFVFRLLRTNLGPAGLRGATAIPIIIKPISLRQLRVKIYKMAGEEEVVLRGHGHCISVSAGG